MDPATVPSTHNLSAARRSAIRMGRAFAACIPCKRIKQKCGDIRPCARCKRLRREDECLQNLEDSENSRIIERPVQFGSHSLDISRSSPPIPSAAVLKYAWSYRVALIYWHSGINYDILANIFNSIPDELSELMGLVSAAIVNRIDQTTSLSSPATEPRRALETASAHLANETAMCDSEQVYGFLEFGIDPFTKKRTSLCMNSRWAHIYGFHKEELCARFANNEGDLPRTQIDALLLILDGLSSFLDDSNAGAAERCYRMHSGRARHPILVWSLWGKVFNALGQVVKVKPPLLMNYRNTFLKSF
jgi:hypothetical protein